MNIDDYRREVLNDLLRTLRFSCSPLEAMLTTKGWGNKTDHNIRDENTLIFSFITHI